MVVVFDLDDTLYDEVDFVKSGFKEIANFLGGEKYFDFMWEEFLKNGSGKIFDKLIEKFGLNVDLQKLIEIYRFHYPNIELKEEVKEILKNFDKLALITDGHYIMQQNKYRALNLREFIEFAVFTDFYHTKKLDLKPFLMVMDYFNDKNFVYVGDNPKKDFLAPKKLGWITIRYKNPRGIYKNFESNADYEILSLKECLKILKG